MKRTFAAVASPAASSPASSSPAIASPVPATNISLSHYARKEGKYKGVKNKCVGLAIWLKQACVVLLELSGLQAVGNPALM